VLFEQTEVGYRAIVGYTWGSHGATESQRNGPREIVSPRSWSPAEVLREDAKNE
jgi:hypothetical protein